MIYNIIPINYFGGLGGQFLSSFIYSASNNRNINWVFSEQGNAHNSEKDIEGCPPFNLSNDDDGVKSTNYLIEFSKTIPENTRIYPHGHFADPDLLMQHFNKQIKIYFEPEQQDEIIGVFMLKHPDGKFKNFDDTSQIEKYKNNLNVAWRALAIKFFKRLCNNCPDLEPGMLNVSWNEMLYLDKNILISKLSEFLQIPNENFQRDKFDEWRSLTLVTVNKLKNAGLI